MLLLFPLAGSAEDPDFERYTHLSEVARQAIDRLDDESSEESRAAAILAAEEVLDWLRDFEGSTGFDDLPAEEQASVTSDRHRWEYNIVRQWLLVGNCAEARDRLTRILSEGVVDSALLPRLSSALAEASQCAAAFGLITVDARPSPAQVIVDGVALGTTDTPHRVDLGTHTLTVAADGFSNVEVEFEVTEPERELAIGPIVLAPLPATGPTPERERSLRRPMLIGAGALVLGGGTGLVVAGQRYDRLASNPPEGEALVDPEGDRRIVRNFRVAGAATMVLGAALLGTGLATSRNRPVRATAFIGPGEAYVRLEL